MVLNEDGYLTKKLSGRGGGAKYKMGIRFAQMSEKQKRWLKCGVETEPNPQPEGWVSIGPMDFVGWGR